MFGNLELPFLASREQHSKAGTPQAARSQLVSAASLGLVASFLRISHANDGEEKVSPTLQPGGLARIIASPSTRNRFHFAPILTERHTKNASPILTKRSAACIRIPKLSTKLRGGGTPHRPRRPHDGALVACAGSMFDMDIGGCASCDKPPRS